MLLTRICHTMISLGPAGSLSATCHASRHVSHACRGSSCLRVRRELFSSSSRFLDGGVAPESSIPVTAARGARDGLLGHVDPEHRDAVARILEQAERAVDSWSTSYTDFYTPPVVADAMVSLGQMASVCAIPWGGYAQAERCRLVIGREEALDALRGTPEQLEGVAAVQCKGNFMFDPATHRDFLGACLGTGIERGKVGDILVTGGQGAQILVAPNMVEHLEQSLTQVRTVPVETRAVDLSALQVRTPRVEERSSVEASMRLDAVASAGFRMSRSKMTDLIKAGDVRVNWRSGAKGSQEVKAGDMISVSGKGRVEVQEAVQTKKGKYAVKMVRYI